MVEAEAAEEMVEMEVKVVEGAAATTGVTTCIFCWRPGAPAPVELVVAVAGAAAGAAVAALAAAVVVVGGGEERAGEEGGRGDEGGPKGDSGRCSACSCQSVKSNHPSRLDIPRSIPWLVSSPKGKRGSSICSWVRVTWLSLYICSNVSILILVYERARVQEEGMRSLGWIVVRGRKQCIWGCRW
jgi:hypothetical protein